jgi:Flp pilus assembly pilin Flp
MERGRKHSAGRDRAEDGERGATLVEYALLVALVALVAISSMSALRNRTREKYEETSAGITEVAGVVIEAPDDDSPGDPDDGVPGSPSASTSCGSPNAATCSFNLTGLPDGASVSWELDGVATGDSGTTYSFAGKKNTTYTVTATISTGASVTRTITCDSSKVCTTT